MADYLSEFIPEIWSAKILDQKDKIHVFGNLANREYEGEITGAGQSVRIPQVGDVTVNTYTRNNFGTGLTLENVNGATLTLTIDQEKYFNTGVDTVDINQAKPKFMDKLTNKAAYAISDAQDSFIAGLYAQAGLTTTSNSASTYVSIGSSNVKSQFLLMTKAFDKANVQSENRWCVIPPELNFELVDAGILEQSNNDQLWTGGKVPNAYGWNIYVSNNVSSPSTAATQFRILFGVGNESITFAEQIVEMDMDKLTKSQKGFGLYMAGLHVYGARLIPDRTGVLYASISND
jgi:hypothetical protein